ncbi:pentatricopeptide repeat-containing protein At1g03540 [Andrographis paniculata]|uniref:pentatricopeptide repeat-containing protein At1g03540 n=1 Tax=Andrographis paniculata TaxID=175694 RepID=UPI0021E78F12|nr:pentatricopeptide repeat-containing protein At1g03540 [Andrographis paniculata]XP_051115050.1 pentatricopeptide repeat-containing protein At1g03540 [Andrographis paniculata]
MRLLSKRHFASISSAHYHSTSSQIIQLCGQGLVSESITLLNSINATPHQRNVAANPITYASIVNVCSKSLHFTLGLQLHCHLIKSGLEADRFVGNSLLALYFKLAKDFNDTRKFFDGMFYKDVVSWSSIISVYIRVGKPWNAIDLYHEMLAFGIDPNAFTLSAVVKACSEVGHLKLGKCLHGVVVTYGFESNEVIAAALIDMYGRSSMPNECHQLFDEMPEPDDVCCTSVISALTRCDCYQQALGMFYLMSRKYGFWPDCFTFGSTLTALGNLERLKQGKEMHALVVTGGFHRDVFVNSSLLDMYAKCGVIEESRRVFDRMERKNPVSWSALLGGYCRKGEFKVVIDLFRDMEKDLYNFGTVLRACAGLATEKLGKEVHCQYLRRCSWRDVVAESALVDLYAKCGCVDFAYRVFLKMPVKNLITWNSMIGGFAQNGRGAEAVSIFCQMIQEKVKPDNISFLEVLFACSHCGLVDQGRKYFVAMHKDYGLQAGLEHYSCMIDLLGRAGNIEEAEDLIMNAEFKNDSSLWASLLGACATTTNPIVAERIAQKMIELKPDYHLSYILLANVYKAVGRWRDSLNVWNQMKRIGVRKMPGTSWIGDSMFSSSSP